MVYDNIPLSILNDIVNTHKLTDFVLEPTNNEEYYEEAEGEEEGDEEDDYLKYLR